MTVYAERPAPDVKSAGASGGDGAHAHRHDEHAREHAPNASSHRPDDHAQHLDPAQQQARAHAMSAYVDPVDEITKSFAALEGQRHAMDTALAKAPHAPTKPAPAVDAKTTAAIQASFATLEQHRIDMDVAKTFTDVKGAMLAGQIVAKQGDVGDQTGRYEILNLLERTTDPAIRHAMIQQYEKQTGESLQGFLANADWKGSRDAAEAQALISSDRDRAARELGALAPDARARLAIEAEKWAAELAAHTTGSGTDTAEHAHAVSNLLAQRTPAQIEAIRAAISSSKNAHGTYELIDRAFSKGHEDEAVAGLGGHKIHTVSVSLASAEGDPVRIKELLHGLTPDEIAKLKRENPTFDPKKNPQWAGEQAKGIEQQEITALLSGDRAAADGDRLQALLQPSMDGVVDMYHPGERGEQLVKERAPEHVLKELEAMPPDQLAAAVAAYDGAHKQKLAAMVKERFAHGATSKDPSVALRLQAVLAGDRASAKAFELQQGLASHDQAKIENALTDSALTADGKDGERHRAERAGMTAGVEALDYAQQMAAAAKRGDVSALAAMAPRTLDQTLDAHYDRELHATTGDAKRKVHDGQIAAHELAGTGDLATETKIHRAREDGDTKGATSLLKQIKTNESLHATEAASKAKYGTGVYEQAKLDDYEDLAGTLHRWYGGDDKDKTTLAQREEIARVSQMSMAQKEAYDVEKYGVPAERSPAIQKKLAIENQRFADNGLFAGSEIARTVNGGAVGTWEMSARETGKVAGSVDASNHLKDGVSPELFQQRVGNASSAQNHLAAEKLKVAEGTMDAVATGIKLASMPFGPAGYMAGEASADVIKMVGKKALADNEYDAHDDAKHAGISAIVNAIPVFGEVFQGAKAAKAAIEAEQLVADASAVKGVASEAGRVGAAELEAGGKDAIAAAANTTRVETGVKTAATTEHTLMMGSQMGGAVAHGVVEGKSPEEIFADVLTTGALFALPGRLSNKVEELFGHGTLLGTAGGMATEVAANATIGGGGVGENTAQALAGRAGHHVANHNHHAKSPHESSAPHEHEAQVEPASVREDAHQLGVANAAAAAIPGTEFHGRSRGKAEPQVVAQKATEAAAKLAAKMGGKPGPDGATIPGPNGPITVRIVTETPHEGPNARVAGYDMPVDGVLTIYVSEQASDHHIERAVAHELAEVSYRLKHGAAADGPDMLAAGSTAKQLSAHDVGRLAELAVLQEQIRAARRDSRPEEVERLQREGAELASHLSIDKSAAHTDSEPDRLRKKLDAIREISRPHASRDKADLVPRSAVDALQELVGDKTLGVLPSNPPRQRDPAVIKLAESGSVRRDEAEQLIASANASHLTKEERDLIARTQRASSSGMPVAKEDAEALKVVSGHLNPTDSHITPQALALTVGLTQSEPQGELKKESVIVDTQIAIAMAKSREELAESPNDSLEIKDEKAVERQYVAAATGADVRMTDLTLKRELHARNKDEAPPSTQKGVDLELPRTSPEYVSLLDTLGRYNIGRDGGLADRVIVADAFFARSNAGPPTFMTGDLGVINNLLRVSGRDPSRLEPAQRAQLGKKGFFVSINGRLLKVMPVYTSTARPEPGSE